MKTLQELVRPNVWALQPYSSARDEYSGVEAHVFLDANENPYNRPNNRYPDPLQVALKERIATLKHIRAEQLFLGNGSDEAIDLIFRVFCRPGVDNVVAIHPTYGMYQVCAEVNDVAYRTVSLDEQFQCHADALLAATDDFTKAIFLCSPNNPTGNSLDREAVEHLLQHFDGLVVVDEAYIDFAATPGYLSVLDRHPNLIVLQTFSKAWGSAAIRLGMAFASADIIRMFNKVKYPYNVNRLTQEAATHLLSRPQQLTEWVQTLLAERERVMQQFRQLPCCHTVYPTDANFFLARVTDAPRIYQQLVQQGIIVRNRSHIHLCQNCLRITIGTPQENNELLAALQTL